jgi:putative membrane protein
VFSKTRVSFAWSEFEETLHEQHEWKDGERTVVDIRATLPAEAFFNTETAVDPWLGSEYFKHLPGILTGLGIIGTFMGLIQGLVEFDPQATQSELLRQSLSGLFNEVRYAFTFSAVAITAAILITLFEKWLYSACAKWVGELAQSLDGLFRAGIGEEYLSSLVQASHESASQMRQLKESLVDDLKSLLTNLTERQIQATQQLSTEFGQQIERSLQAPLEKIAETVRVASGQQHQAVGTVLENLMTSFIAQMRETMGGQLGDLGSLLRQSTQSMTQVELAVRALVSAV